jgi:hypothetical protein
MALSGERLLIAATLDPVHVGTSFDELPIHLPVLDHFSIQGDRRFNRLTTAMDNIFITQASLTTAADRGERQGLYGGKVHFVDDSRDMPARLIVNTSSGPWSGLRALVHSLGEFDENYAFKNVVDNKGNFTFKGYVADTNERSIQKGESILFSSVALIGMGSAAQKARVIKTISLRKNNA